MKAFNRVVCFSSLFLIAEAATAQAGAGGGPTENVAAALQDAAKFHDDAVCYAQRYKDLFKGFCKRDVDKCNAQGLFDHYQKYGQKKQMIWGCRNRDIVPAKPVAFTEFEQEAPEVHVLVFETNPERAAEMMLSSQSLAAGMDLTVFGTGTEFEGFGTKWAVVKPLLEDMVLRDEKKLIAIVDGRDVLLNIHKADPYQGREVAESFSLAYQALTNEKPGAVVMSTEGQCCVSALTYVEPGDYFDARGNRVERACASGTEGCGWNGDARKLPWEDFQRDLAKDTTGLDVRDIYLNAGLVAGFPDDLLRVIDTADLLPSEDDQAVFTDYMYNFPDEIVLDYAQQMFGNARWTHGMSDAGCPFDRHPSVAVGSLIHKETNTMPLFLHGPGKFFECLDVVAERIGYGGSDNEDEEGVSQPFLRANAGASRRLGGDNYYGPPDDPDDIDEEKPYNWWKNW